MCLRADAEEVRHVSRNADSFLPSRQYKKRARLSQHFVTWGRHPYFGITRLGPPLSPRDQKGLLVLPCEARERAASAAL